MGYVSESKYAVVCRLCKEYKLKKQKTCDMDHCSPAFSLYETKEYQLLRDLVRRLEHCYTKSGKLDENYYENVILEDLTKEQNMLFKEILK